MDVTTTQTAERESPSAVLTSAEMNPSAVEFARSFTTSVKQAIRAANGENLGTGAEEWLAGLQREVERVKDGN